MGVWLVISFSAKSRQIGGGMYIFASCIYLICEAISAIAWSIPHFKYYFNFIKNSSPLNYSPIDFLIARLR